MSTNPSRLAAWVRNLRRRPPKSTGPERLESFFGPTVQTFLIAVVMRDNIGTHDRSDVEAALVALMPRPSAVDDHRITLEEWWVAEDDRLEPSPNDSAIFVPKGMQTHIEHVLHAQGFGPWFSA